MYTTGEEDELQSGKKTQKEREVWDVSGSKDVSKVITASGSGGVSPGRKGNEMVTVGPPVGSPVGCARNCPNHSGRKRSLISTAA